MLSVLCNSAIFKTQWSTSEAGVQNNHLFNFSLGFTAKKIMGRFCVLVILLYNPSGDAALVFCHGVGKISCRTKPSFDLTSFPHGKNDTDALSSLLLYSMTASGENHAHTRYENSFLQQRYILWEFSVHCFGIRLLPNTMEKHASHYRAEEKRILPVSACRW